MKNVNSHFVVDHSLHFSILHCEECVRLREREKNFVKNFVLPSWVDSRATTHRSCTQNSNAMFFQASSFLFFYLMSAVCCCFYSFRVCALHSLNKIWEIAHKTNKKRHTDHRLGERARKKNKIPVERSPVELYFCSS